MEIIELKELEKKHNTLKHELGEESIFNYMKNRPLLSKLNRFGNYNSKKRKELFCSGYLAYAYCYITFNENDNRFKANILFSPDPNIKDIKKVLEDTYSRLEQFKLDYEFKKIPRDRKNMRLYNDLFSEENDPSFVSIPDILTDNNYIQVSFIEFEKDFAMPKELGKFMMIILYNSKISTMVMPYPDYFLNKL